MVKPKSKTFEFRYPYMAMVASFPLNTDVSRPDGHARLYMGMNRRAEPSTPIFGQKFAQIFRFFS